VHGECFSKPDFARDLRHVGENPSTENGGGGSAGTGGGGGGSSFVIAGATNVSSALSTLTPDGQVTITYDPTTDGCPTPTASPAAVIGVSSRFTG
jgi:hypothetical protein